MEHYLIEVISFQAIFLAVYWLFFRQSTFFKTHRIYLLAAPLLAFILPVIKISVLQTVVPESLSSVFLPEVIIGISISSQEVLDQSPEAVIWDLWWVYYAGVMASLILFGFKVHRLIAILKFRDSSKNIIQIPRSTAAFTFLNYICIGDGVDALSRKHILAHERIHVEQKHTWDLLVFEALRIVMWFNPLIYLYQKEIARVHEYLADAAAVHQITKKEYYEKLLNTAFGTNNLSFTNTFYNHSSIKNRISMLQKSKSKKTELLKYVVIIPMILGMLFYVSCSDDGSDSYGPTEDAYAELLLDFIEAGGTEQMLQDYFIYKEHMARAIENPESMDRKSIVGLGQVISNTHKIGIKINVLGDNLYEVEKIDSNEFPFSEVDQVPLYKDCGHLANNDERRKCMSDAINAHIAESFNTELGAELGLSGLQRIYALFKISGEGTVIDVKVRAPSLALQEEGVRVINSLPKMEQGAMHQGKPVTVSYTLPIVFKIEE